MATPDNLLSGDQAIGIYSSGDINVSRMLAESDNLLEKTKRGLKKRSTLLAEVDPNSVAVKAPQLRN